MNKMFFLSASGIILLGLGMAPRATFAEKGGFSNRCVESIGLTRDEKETLNDLDPIIPDPLCCLNYKAESQERVDCLNEKIDRIASLNKWLDDKVVSKGNGLKLKVCKISSDEEEFATLFKNQCELIKATAPYSYGDLKGATSVNISTLKCYLSKFADHYNSFSDDLKTIETCKK